MKTDEIVAVGSIFTLLITSAMYFNTTYKQKNEIQELRAKYEQARNVAVELHQESKETKVELEQVKKDIEEVQPLIRIKEELRKYTLEEQAIGLAVGWTESTWNYNANHQGLYSNFCGNMPWHWDDFLIDKGVHPKSAAACVEIYNYYKNKFGTKYSAIKAYKGIKENTYLVYRTIKLYEVVLKILKEEKEKKKGKQ